MLPLPRSILVLQCRKRGEAGTRHDSGMAGTLRRMACRRSSEHQNRDNALQHAGKPAACSHAMTLLGWQKPAHPHILPGRSASVRARGCAQTCQTRCQTNRKLPAENIWGSCHTGVGKRQQTCSEKLAACEAQRPGLCSWMYALLCLCAQAAHSSGARALWPSRRACAPTLWMAWYLSQICWQVRPSSSACSIKL